MSRIGKLAINVPAKVNVEISENLLTIKGTHGQLSREIPELLSVSFKENNTLIISRKNDTRSAKEFHGLFRSLVNNMVVGVENLFTKSLEMKGVGYKGIMDKETLILNVGYTHPINITPPKGIKISIENNTMIKIQGIDKEAVGLLAQSIRATRPPEPYKGKGILYKGEVILRKAGKSSK
jgi:large subunit ribosomal protein L6